MKVRVGCNCSFSSFFHFNLKRKNFKIEFSTKNKINKPANKFELARVV